MASGCSVCLAWPACCGDDTVLACAGSPTRTLCPQPPHGSTHHLKQPGDLPSTLFPLILHGCPSSLSVKYHLFG